ncbi:MAG: histidine phosphatase family protein [Thiothrix sp.]
MTEKPTSSMSPPLSDNPTTVDFLRHGQVATPDLFCAPSTEPLGIHGWKQMTLATQHGVWNVVVSSPSRRCHDFARLLAQRQKCPFVVDERFGEMHFGDWIGRTQAEIWEQEPELMRQLWYQPRRFVAPNGEAMEDFIARVHDGWEALQREYTGQRVIVLTHAGVMRVIIAKVLDILYQKTLRVAIGYAQITRVRVYPDGETALLGHGLPHA